MAAPLQRTHSTCAIFKSVEERLRKVSNAVLENVISGLIQRAILALETDFMERNRSHLPFCEALSQIYSFYLRKNFFLNEEDFADRCDLLFKTYMLKAKEAIRYREQLLFSPSMTKKQMKAFTHLVVTELHLESESAAALEPLEHLMDRNGLNKFASEDEALLCLIELHRLSLKTEILD